MRIRLIGLGDTGQDVLAGCCRTFHNRGLDRFIERKIVLQLTTFPFVVATNTLIGLAGDQMRSLADQLEFRKGMAYLFFGGPATLEGIRKRMDELKHPRLAPTEEQAGLRRLREVEANLAPPTRLLFRLNLDKALLQHSDTLAQHADWLDSEFFLTPAQPLLTHPFQPQTAIIGRELGETFLRDQRRRWRLLEGLGQAGSRLDIVVIVFSLNDSFGGEGSEIIAQAIRRVLEYPESNRIVAILGFGVFDGTTDIDGRYTAQYLRASRLGNGFDGLITRPNGPNLGVELANALAAVALSSDPGTIQIDNPDSNQLQRDFGRSLVGFGYAEQPIDPPPAILPPAIPLLLGLYNNALGDWAANHCLAFAENPVGAQLNQIWAALKTWVGKNPPPSIQAMSIPPINEQPDAGRIEHETARKIVVYVGGGDALPGPVLETLRQQIALDFPRARTVIYKYSLPPVNPIPQNLPEMGWLRRNGQRLRNALGIRANVPLQPIPANPMRLHVALYIIDCFETRAVARFHDFLTHHFRATANGLHIDPIAPNLAVVATCLNTIFAGALAIDCSNNGVLGGLNQQAANQIMALTASATPGEFLDVPGLPKLHAEADTVSITVGRVRVSLSRNAENDLRTPKWLGDVFVGLSWVCHERIERRQVSGTFGGLL